MTIYELKKDLEEARGKLSGPSGLQAAVRNVDNFLRPEVADLVDPPNGQWIPWPNAKEALENITAAADLLVDAIDNLDIEIDEIQMAQKRPAWEREAKHEREVAQAEYDQHWPSLSNDDLAQ